MLTTVTKPDGTIELDIQPAKKPFPYGLFVFELLIIGLAGLIWDALWLPILVAAGFIGWHLFKVSMRPQQKIEIKGDVVSNGTESFNGQYEIDIVNALKRPEFLQKEMGSRTGNTGFALGAGYKDQMYEVSYEINVFANLKTLRKFATHLDFETANEIKRVIEYSLAKK
ncbi:hypothetical protein [Methyloradius palustris]|uniref:Uncharacterized protein n=1 Tax=Methyloradius palustris TaxID=2778876 RepID=A0A8D5JVQ0_9PROT|nr:hypothetical protein [Methyloradius palustris]BCM24344.1 hypothetical protein ZMTM_06030 [Methyloradius palustris]